MKINLLMGICEEVDVVCEFDNCMRYYILYISAYCC